MWEIMGGNFSLESCQCFGLKGASGDSIPIRDCTGEEGILVVVCSGYYGLAMDTTSLESNVMTNVMPCKCNVNVL